MITLEAIIDLGEPSAVDDCGLDSSLMSEGSFPT